MRQFRAQFEHPDRTFFPTPIWWWSGAPLEPERLRRQMELLAGGGAPNLVVFNLAPTGPAWGADADDPPFLSERWWQILDGVCGDAEELGVSLWLYDQIGFSGANLQGRLVRADPALAGMSIERVWLDVDDEGEVMCPSAGVPVAAVALEKGALTPLAVGERVRWRGRGRLMLFYVVERGFDYFSADACNRLFALVHGELATRLERWIGNVIVGTFQDELPPMPTWSGSFAEAFERRFGYDLTSRLAHLWEEVDGDSGAIRRDFHALRGSLAEAAFFRPLGEWHERRGLLCGFDQNEGARQGEPIGASRLFGDYLRTHRWLSVPGSDHHGDSKIHSSLAHAYGHERVWFESFHTSGWGGTLEETFDWLVPFIGAGATLYDPHATYYSTRRGWWDWAPPATDWRQPYWPHYQEFARAVARLCGVLSCGTHVCDVAVLFPDATVQSGLRLDGPDEAAAAAEAVYIRIVGTNQWYAPKPGILNELARDFDVLDDDTVAASVVSAGALEHHGEAYRAVVLPACRVLDSAVAARLVEFVDAGGTLVAVGAVPSVDALRERFATGQATFVETPEELGTALAGVPATVHADVPTLCRRNGNETVVFVPAAYPRATRIEFGEPHAESWGSWDGDLQIDFDASRYAATRELRVEGVRGAPELWEPFSGRRRRLEAREDGSGVTVDVPFGDGPVALLAWGTGDDAAATDQRATGEILTLDGPWEVQVERTIGDDWDDLALPDEDFAVAVWDVEHADGDDWVPARATFGTRAHVRGADGEWRPAAWSPSRGILKDVLHNVALGPKGHVPEEFVDFGYARAGDAVQLQAVLHADASVEGHLVVGAAAAKGAWLAGEPIALAGDGYLSHGAVLLPAGTTALDLQLRAEEDGRVRAHVAVVRDLDAYLRPEWLRAPGPVVRDSVISFSRAFRVDGEPAAACLLVGANVPCRVLLDGAELGRQTPVEVEEDGLELYEPADRVQPGEHELRLELHDTGPQIASALFDGVVGATVLRSDAETVTARDGVVVGTANRRAQIGYGASGRRRQLADIAVSHLWRRPHPLRDAAWLEGPQSDVVAPVEIRADASVVPQRLRVTAPPGAERMRESLAHGCTLLDRGAVVPLQPVELTIEPAPGLAGGGVLAGPIEFAVGQGEMPLGDWQELGLPSHSGAVVYRRTLGDVPRGRARLDLGEVRGTAEVWVDGRSCGVRVLSPYAFEVDTAPGSRLEIRIFNTLAPHLDAVSPTPYVFAGQKRSGLFGPVTLAW
jgi:hypothetical protein